jgi:diadenosine tetraphosphatase ApaH/serine/threonine PP2A family protein phosphatase
VVQPRRTRGDGVDETVDLGDDEGVARRPPERRTEDGTTLVHGSLREPLWEYITSAPVARVNLAALTTPLGLHGHTHLPIVWAERDGVVETIAPSDGSMFGYGGRRALLNPGSVGQPRDGEPTASYLVLDTAAARARWHRVPYDIPAVQSAMRAHSLPGRLVERLSFGV